MSNYDGDDWSNSSVSDEFSETTSRSWFQRIGDSIKGILVGLLLVVVSGGLLFWNEGRAAKTAAALTEGAGVVVSVPNTAVSPANNGKLVHVSGDTTASSPATDNEIGFSQKGLKLSRKVEMYQWKETKESKTRDKLGGGQETVTTYRYSKEWSDRAVDSSRFRRSNGHQNPSFPSTQSRSFPVADAKLGAFRLDPALINGLGSGEHVDVPDTLKDAVVKKFGDKARVQSGTIYVGSNPSSPSVGDVRITYSLLPLQPISVVAKQTNGGFSSYTASNGRSILLSTTGTKDAAAMFKSAQDANSMLTWGLRVLGIVLMFAGFSMILGPIAVFASVIPMLGNIAGFGTSLIAMLATTITAPVIIAIAWFFYRPMVSIIVLAVGAAIFVGIKYLGRQRAAASAPARA
ncbi:MAG: TMEM43 family protein [Hyphomicrobiales bacterium]|nr:TMEM43 family protein [Hyphomicrobiales bacterium]